MQYLLKIDFSFRYGCEIFMNIFGNFVELDNLSNKK